MTSGLPPAASARGQGLGLGPGPPPPRSPTAAGGSGPDRTGPGRTAGLPRTFPPAPSCAAPAPRGSVPRAAPVSSSSASSPLPLCRRPAPAAPFKPSHDATLASAAPNGRPRRRDGREGRANGSGRGAGARPRLAGGSGPLAASRAPGWVTWLGDARAGNRARTAPPRLKGPAARPCPAPCACAEAGPALLGHFLRGPGPAPVPGGNAGTGGGRLGPGSLPSLLVQGVAYSGGRGARCAQPVSLPHVSPKLQPGARFVPCPRPRSPPPVSQAAVVHPERPLPAPTEARDRRMGGCLITLTISK